MRVDDLDSARENYEKALTIFQEINNNWGTANTCKSLGDLAMRVDDLDSARENYERALTIYQEINNNLGTANTLMSFGYLSALICELDQANNYLDNAFTIFKEIDELWGQAYIHMGRAVILFKSHANATAKQELEECLSILHKVRGYGEAAGWMIFFAKHLKLNNFKEGSKICLEYAGQLASKTQDLHLQSKIKQQFSEIE
jgi:tetratricopeptide (TPR) repeat protein